MWLGESTFANNNIFACSSSPHCLLFEPFAGWWLWLHSSWTREVNTRKYSSVSHHAFMPTLVCLMFLPVSRQRRWSWPVKVSTETVRRSDLTALSYWLCWEKEPMERCVLVVWLHPPSKSRSYFISWAFCRAPSHWYSMNSSFIGLFNMYVYI